MKAKHKDTLQRIFQQPVQAGIVWKDIEAMLQALGAEIIEGRGSRVRIVLNNIRAVFHRPPSSKGNR